MLECQLSFFFETQAELVNFQICLIFLPNLANLPNSLKIKNPLNVSTFLFPVEMSLILIKNIFRSDLGTRCKKYTF